MLCHLEDAHPTQTVELALVRMKHELTGVIVAELKDVPLGLAHRNDISVFVWLQPSASAIHMKQVGMQMKGIDQIEFGEVAQVDAN